MSMSEFMIRYGDQLGWPKEHVEGMAARQAAENLDFQIIVKQMHITVPSDSISGYLKAEAARLAAKISEREAEIAAAVAAEKKEPEPPKTVGLPEGRQGEGDLVSKALKRPGPSSGHACRVGGLPHSPSARQVRLMQEFARSGFDFEKLTDIAKQVGFKGVGVRRQALRALRPFSGNQYLRAALMAQGIDFSKIAEQDRRAASTRKNPDGTPDRDLRAVGDGDGDQGRTRLLPDAEGRDRQASRPMSSS
ncbi:MAG: hypothetical protein MZV49_24165 [Rhodopseudomonas palustris]|nr:hypothetical protein [Rhodopseudomonas palustris]